MIRLKSDDDIGSLSSGGARVHSLREVNRLVLSAAFSWVLRQLEATTAEGEGDYYYWTIRRVLRMVGG